MRPAAILWDYDGTLVDSTVKNRVVTIELLRRFDADIEKHLPPALQSVQSYRDAILRWNNWREEFRRELGLDDARIDEVARSWSAAQLADPLQPPLFCGLRDVLPRLAAVAPMAICSQNGSGHIRATLRRYGIQDCFGAVIGRDEVPLEEQKPHPNGFLQALAQLGLRGDEGMLVYIGDHSMDVKFAHAAVQALQQRGVAARVLTVTTRFGDHACLNSLTGGDLCAVEPEDLLTLFCEA